MTTLYEKDFCAWSEQQSKLLLDKRWDEIDIEHLVEEVIDLRSSTKHALRSHLKNLIMHLLKYTFQPELRSRSWSCSIAEAREQVEDILEENSSLKRTLPEILCKTYEAASRKASRETGIDIRTFPKVCPWTIEEILDTKHGE
jgi:predicted  nucleic acid-binding Zn-ribbon protein